VTTEVGSATQQPSLAKASRTERRPTSDLFKRVHWEEIGQLVAREVKEIKNPA